MLFLLGSAQFKALGILSQSRVVNKYLHQNLERVDVLALTMTTLITVLKPLKPSGEFLSSYVAHIYISIYCIFFLSICRIPFWGNHQFGRRATHSSHVKLVKRDFGNVQNVLPRQRLRRWYTTALLQSQWTRYEVCELGQKLAVSKPEHKMKYVRGHTPYSYILIRWWLSYIHEFHKVTRIKSSAQIWTLYYTFTPPISSRILTVLQVVHLSEDKPRTEYVSRCPLSAMLWKVVLSSVIITLKVPR